MFLTRVRLKYAQGGSHQIRSHHRPITLFTARDKTSSKVLKTQVLTQGVSQSGLIAADVFRLEPDVVNEEDHGSEEGGA